MKLYTFRLNNHNKNSVDDAVNDVKTQNEV